METSVETREARTDFTIGREGASNDGTTLEHLVRFVKSAASSDEIDGQQTFRKGTDGLRTRDRARPHQSNFATDRVTSRATMEY